MQTAYAQRSGGTIPGERGPGEIENTGTAVQQAMEHYMALWNRHAIDEHSKLFTEDADLVNVVGMHLRGRQAIQEQHEQLHRTIFANSVSRALDVSVHPLGRATALVHMHWEMAGAAKLPGWNVPEPRTGVMTLLWVNQGSGWRVRAVHNTDTIPVAPLPNG